MSIFYYLIKKNYVKTYVCIVVIKNGKPGNLERFAGIGSVPYGIEPYYRIKLRVFRII